MTNVAINGFGRIGRQFFKAALDKKAKFKIVAINDLTSPENLAYLLKYDSVYGRSKNKISFGKNFLQVDGVKYPIYQEKEPNKLPWKDLKIDVVVESTGFFTKEEGAKLHLDAGAKRVVISAPGKGAGVMTYMKGVNAEKLNAKDKIISNASCTTNSIGPVLSIIQNKFGIAKALMTTVHAITATQKLVDSPDEKDFRRGRAAGFNIVPTSTGAADATTQAMPVLAGKFDGISVRVPVITGSLSDVTMLLKKKTTVEEINQTFRDMAKTPVYKGVLQASDEDLVSTDIIGTPYSCIVDLALTKVVDGDLVKVFAWYDNEWGYSNRLVEMVESVCKLK